MSEPAKKPKALPKQQELDKKTQEVLARANVEHIANFLREFNSGKTDTARMNAEIVVPTKKGQPIKTETKRCDSEKQVAVDLRKMLEKVEKTDAIPDSSIGLVQQCYLNYHIANPHKKITIFRPL